MSKDAKEGTIGWQRQRDAARARGDFMAAHDERHRRAGTPDPFEERRRAMAEIAGRRGREIELDAAGVDGADRGIKAHSDFKGNYQDIVGDKKLYGLMRAMDVADVQRGNERPPAVRYEAYGDAIRQSKDDPHFKEMLEYGDPAELAVFVLGVIDHSPETDGEGVATSVIAKMKRDRKLGQAARDPAQEVIE